MSKNIKDPSTGSNSLLTEEFRERLAHREEDLGLREKIIKGVFEAYGTSDGISDEDLSYAIYILGCVHVELSGSTESLEYTVKKILEDTLEE